MIIIANWKMNLDFDKSLDLADKYLKLELPVNYKIKVLASDLVLQDLVVKFKGSQIEVFAQDCSKFPDKGSFTGEISAEQLKKLKVAGVLLGHIERRLLLHEADEDIALKVRNALNANLQVVLTIGELEASHTYKESLEIINSQLEAGLNGITEDLTSKLMIAYESASSISSLRSQSDIEDDLELIFHKLEFFRTWLDQRYPNTNIPLLYGGSLEREEAKVLKRTGLLQGLLIGRNSLQYTAFKSLLQALVLA